MITKNAIATALVAAAALALGACSGSSATETGVATLDGTDVASSESDTGSGGDAEMAALEFAQCMRDQGIEFDDPTVGADGNIEFAPPDRSGNVDRAALGEAADSCGDLLEGVTVNGPGSGIGGGGRGDLEVALLGYTDCLRGEGLDVGDITFGEPGTGGGGGGGGAGGPGAGGDPGQRFVTQLGLDADDPDVAAAMESCESALDEAFAGVGR